jgi:acyl dehydratase
MPARTLTLPELKEATGQEAGVSDWIEITQDMIDRFADLTGDHQWIHIDPERARTDSPFGTTIAHGFLTLSLISSMTHQAVEIHGPFKMAINYGLNRVRFVSPVPSGSRVRGHFTPQQVSESEVVWLVTVEREGGEKPVLVAEWVARFY